MGGKVYADGRMRIFHPSKEELAGFLDKNEHLVFHTWEYKEFIETAFDCNYHILAVEDEGIRIILPIVEVRSRLFGNKIVSSAYIEYGGFAGDKRFVRPMLDYLEKYSAMQYLEIRDGLPGYDDEMSKHLARKDLYQRFVLELDTEEETWKSIQKSKRKAIKKSMKNTVVHEITTVDRLYKLYCRNMRSFGSPPYSRKYFESFMKLSDRGLAKVFGCYHKGELAAALLGFCYKDRVHILIAVSDPKYADIRPNDAVHWHFIKWACQNGYRYFDFGRVREESGQYEYKQKWGPKQYPLPSYFKLWKAKEIPMMDPSRYDIALAVWRKMPLSLTKIVGMRLRKGLGI